MDLTNFVHRQYSSAVGPFSQLYDLINSTGPFDASQFSADPYLPDGVVPGGLFDLDSRLLVPSMWTVVANFSLGRRWIILPNIEPLRPQQITVRVPSHSKWPPHLLKSLQASASFHTSDSRLANLMISRYLAQVLTIWSSSFDDFSSYFKTLPFGTEIVVEEICADMQDVKVRVSPSPWNDSFLTVDELEEQWRFSLSLKVIELKDLKLLRTFNETVVLVRAEQHFDAQPVIFKSSPNAPIHIYHELWMLLTLPQNPHLITPPLGLVSVPDVQGGPAKVVGIILQYYEEGTLAQQLRTRSMSGTLSWHVQIRWAKEVASALIFLNKYADTYYLDLKPDNILLSNAKPDHDGSIVLIDFEQNGAPNTWEAPEIIHIETLNILSRVAPDSDIREAYQSMLNDLVGARKAGMPGRYQHCPRGHHVAWPHLSPSECEAAEVFALGKVLYCIFEGVDSISTSVMMSRPTEQELQFPCFLRSPPALQQLILACTAGAREHDREAPFVVRVGNTLLPRGKSGVDGEPSGSARDLVEISRNWWMKVLTDAGNFWAAKVRYSSGVHTEDDLVNLPYIRRPTLEEVLKVLNDIERD
ncbi:hypothetical protein BJ875DRAFT_202576 [Amylocarpus encephaloides]|uniref:Protein kinase domain-containing protein n=1 Tax=Amylocarpus encephaloides TaxID=45428 RepID=A0A9P7Y910_9HELO|nr:hypothetical protein BJ875DRAFT_202576 [Amylocarpus encephaloides]